MGKPLAGWTIVFDLDGTLVDTAPDLLNATNHALELAGRQAITLEQVRHIIGSGAKAMMQQGFELTGEPASEREIDELWHPFIDHYTQNIAVDSRPFPGCLDCLNALLEHGATLAVCTNKLKGLADQLLEELEISTLFKTCFGSDSVPHKKPNGEHILRTIDSAGGMPERSIMIGDSQTDEKAAHNAGLPFIFVPFGYGPGTTVNIEATAIVGDYADMLSTILEIAR